MKKEVSEVFEKEQSNESCIHLYLEECGWCAYEVLRGIKHSVCNG